MCIRDRLLSYGLLHQDSAANRQNSDRHRSSSCFSEVIVRIKVVGQYVHAEPFQNMDQELCNLSRADDACCFSVHIEPHESVKGKVSDVYKRQVCVLWPFVGQYVPAWAWSAWNGTTP